MAPVQWSEDKATAGAQLNGELIGQQVNINREHRGCGKGFSEEEGPVGMLSRRAPK